MGAITRACCGPFGQSAPQIAGWLIYSARRTDREQRVLIRAQNRQLSRQNRELDEIMAVTAHDLRSPLHGLRNMFDLAIERAPAAPGALLHAAREGVYSLDAMLALVTRLLDAHAAEHRAPATPVREDLAGHLHAAARRIGPQAVAAAIELDLELPEPPVFAVLDPEGLEQILDNLLGNAVRHSPPHARLRLAGAGQAGGALITVEDRGPGIDPAHRAALFTKFDRGAGRQGAAGMGLFIARRQAERMGATLSFRPAEPTGAIFELVLPA